MENNAFYVWDNHRKVWTSNPDMRDETEWFVWDPHSWWEYNKALMLGQEWFPRAEIYRGVRPPGPGEFGHDDKRKKVAILFFEHFARPLSGGKVADSGPIEDHPNLIADTNLNWADLVIVHSTEPINNWWPRIYGDINYAVHNDQIKCLVAGHMSYSAPPADRFFTDHLSFFSYVSCANQVRDINETTVPFRKHMFDVLMGTVKTARLYLMYRLLESDFIDQCLINLQPRPWPDPLWIKQVDPEGLAKHGLITSYTSPALYDLEEPVVQQFKDHTKDLQPRDQYSVNLVGRAGFNIPGENTPMSVIVPWGIYQSSWYSIVCETVDWGYTGNFVTEKTAKCLFARRIFIMFAGAGLLNRLHQLGFRTFHGDDIDESYDNEPDNAKRYAMAWEQIQRLYRTDPRTMYAKYQDVLNHNQQLMMTLPQQQLNDICEFIHKPFFTQS
jgi:hypothetical protein